MRVQTWLPVLVLAATLLGVSAADPADPADRADRADGQSLGQRSGQRGPVDAHAADAKTLSRRKRYVVFRKGSSIQLVYCMSFRGYIPFQTIFVFGLTAGIAWPLPTESEQLYLQRRDVGRHPDREHRVNLFRSVQTFLNQQGFRGEQCVQRTICESSDPHQSRGAFMKELLNILFNLPEHDGSNETTWDSARFNGTRCEIRFPHCSSILDISMPTESIKK